MTIWFIIRSFQSLFFSTSIIVQFWKYCRKEYSSLATALPPSPLLTHTHRHIQWDTRVH